MEAGCCSLRLVSLDNFHQIRLPFHEFPVEEKSQVEGCCSLVSLHNFHQIRFPFRESLEEDESLVEAGCCSLVSLDDNFHQIRLIGGGRIPGGGRML